MSISEINQTTARDVLRPLRQVRQYREFTDEPVSDEHIDAIIDVARWTGSGMNAQPWRFSVTRDASVLRELAEAGLPQTRSLRTAPALIAVAMPVAPDHDVSNAYDEGRVAERILIAASMIGLGAGIAWVRTDVRPAFQALLRIPEGYFVRTLVVVGHPTEAGRAPKAPPGQARLPREEVVLPPR